MQAKYEQQQEAINLRVNERLSLKEIAKQLGVAKSSVSLWVRNAPLTHNEIAAKYKHYPVLRETCVGCGNQFEKKNPFQAYCTKKCQRVAKHQRRNPEREVTCLRCGLGFQTRRTRKRYCSPKCQRVEKGKRQRLLSKAQSVVNWRQRLKLRAVEYKGGKCEVCGYSRCIRGLKFHHLDPSQKDFGISSKGEGRSWERVKAELDKCILVCGNCHDEIHEGLVVQLRVP